MGDVSLVANVSAAACQARLDLTHTTFNTYGLVNTYANESIPATPGVAEMLTTLKASPGTTINILGDAKQFQFPRKATA